MKVTFLLLYQKGGCAFKSTQFNDAAISNRLFCSTVNGETSFRDNLGQLFPHMLPGWRQASTEELQQMHTTVQLGSNANRCELSISNRKNTYWAILHAPCTWMMSKIGQFIVGHWFVKLFPPSPSACNLVYCQSIPWLLKKKKYGKVLQVAIQTKSENCSILHTE